MNSQIRKQKLCYSTPKENTIKDYRENNKEDKWETIKISFISH